MSLFQSHGSAMISVFLRVCVYWIMTFFTAHSTCLSYHVFGEEAVHHKVLWTDKNSSFIFSEGFKPLCLIIHLLMEMTGMSASKFSGFSSSALATLIVNGGAVWVNWSGFVLPWWIALFLVTQCITPKQCSFVVSLQRVFQVISQIGTLRDRLLGIGSIFLFLLRKIWHAD